MSDATATILQSYGKPYEFCMLDRKVVVCTENDVDEQNDPSLYSLVRAWVRNGYIPARKSETEASPPFSLPPSQPATKEQLVYPDECFTKSYVKDETDNLASVYKTAWITTHSTYTAFKAKRRRRHETRHSALLAVAQQNQKSRLNKPPKPPQPTVPAPVEPVPPPQPPTRPAPLPPSAATHMKAQRPVAEDLLRSHNLTMRSGSVPLANTPQPLEKRASNGASRQSPTSFGVGYMPGVDSVRQAHNLADRGNPLPAASASPAVDPKRTARVPGPVNLADMHLRGAHAAMGAEVPGGDTAAAAAMPRGSPSSMAFARPVHPQPDAQCLTQPTKAQLQAHIHAQAQAQVRAQLEAAQAAAAAAEAAQGDAGAAGAPRGPLSAAKVAGPAAGQPGVSQPAPLRDRREQGWRGRDLGRQFGAMSGSVPGGSGGGGGFGGGNGEAK